MLSHFKVNLTNSYRVSLSTKYETLNRSDTETATLSQSIPESQSQASKKSNRQHSHTALNIKSVSHSPMSHWNISLKIRLWFKLAEQNNGLRNEKLKENTQYSADYSVWSRLQLLSSTCKNKKILSQINKAILNVKNIIFSVLNWDMLVLTEH